MMYSSATKFSKIFKALLLKKYALHVKNVLHTAKTNTQRSPNDSQDRLQGPSWVVLIFPTKAPPIGVYHSGRSQRNHRANHRADFNGF